MVMKPIRWAFLPVGCGDVLGEVAHGLEGDLALVDEDDDRAEEAVGVLGDIRGELRPDALLVRLALRPLLNAEVSPAIHLPGRADCMNQVADLHGGLEVVGVSEAASDGRDHDSHRDSPLRVSCRCREVADYRPGAARL